MPCCAIRYFREASISAKCTGGINGAEPAICKAKGQSTMSESLRSSLRISALFKASLALAVLAGVSSASAAQSPSQHETRTLVRRLDPADLQARMQRHTGQHALARAGFVQVAGLFGDSDADRAREQHEQSQDTIISTLNQRVGDLEDSVRRLTGHVEELEHRVREQQTRTERMQRDFDYKICKLTAANMGAAASGDGGIPCTSADQGSVQQNYPQQGFNQQGGTITGAVMPSGNGAQGNGRVQLAPPPGILGTLSRSDAQSAPVPVGAPSQPTDSGSRAQFDSAMNLLAKAQYDEASGAFRNFADTHPKDDLAPQALYWVGDIAYVQKQYPDAARAFAEGLKKYPKSSRGPESMLKLGQSLLALNQKQEGCTTLGAIRSKYPQASKSVLARSSAARKGASCR